MQVLGFTLFFFKNTYATSSLPSLECFKRATLRVSLPEGTTCGSSSDPWLNEGWILYKSGTNWTFTVKITQHSRRHSSYDTHLIIALNYEAYEKLLNLKINGSYICKNSFKYGTPQPYNVWTWPDDVYSTWFNDESVNLGTILPRKSKIVIVTALFSDTQNVKMHFDAYGKKTRCTPHHKSSIHWSPNSEDSTVLSVTEPPCAEFTYSPVFPKTEELITFNATLSYSPNGYIASYTWNFGDGSPEVTETDPITYHSFPLSGNYTVTLNVTDNLGLTDSTNKTISVSGIPTATFIWTPEYPLANEAVTFNASGSLPNGGVIVEYAWDFESDGVIDAYGSIVTHTYDQIGNYTVTLNVTDSEGFSDIVSKIIQVRKSPVASFVYSPSSPLVGEPVTFDASASSPNGGVITSYIWDFGDGNVTVTVNPIITHTYFAYGTYTVTLNVTDSEGLSGVESRSIRILIPPIAHFTYSPSTPTAGDTVTFNASESIDPDTSITTYTWNFGDGNITVTSHPLITHVFNVSTSYTVTLTVTDTDGLENSTSLTIYVRDYPHASFVYSPSSPLVGEPVTFDASASSPNGGVITSYIWDFGDGNVTVTVNPIITHTYFAYGTYTVTLNVTDSEGLWNEDSSTIQVRAYPKANFTISPNPPFTISTTLTFNASGSLPNGGVIVEYAWDFESDGVIDAYGSIVTHTYAAYGVYNITLTVTDSEGLSDSITQTVTILSPPTASFTYLPETIIVNEPVTFNASLSYDPDGTIVNYAWDFGDGDIGNGMIVQHAYLTSGNFTVTLTVTDNDGLSDSTVYVITVKTPPTASFIYIPTYPQVNQTVTFDASSSKPNGGTITSYSWNFGDGNTTVTTNPVVTHTYATAGNYTVTLNVTDSDGLWSYIVEYVFVSSPQSFLESASYTAHNLGETFEINVDIANVTDLYGFEFKLQYNITLLDAVKVEEGPFLQSFGATFTAKLEANDTAGYVWIAITLLAPSPPAQGNGTLAIITFNVTYSSPWPKTVGCSLHFYDTKLSDVQGDPIPHQVIDGYYEFEPTPPTPPTLMVTPQRYQAEKLGETFEVNIEISNLDALWDLYGWQASLYYNTTLLDVLAVTEGPFLPSFQGPNGTFFLAQVHEDAGYVHLAELFLGERSAIPYNGGILATVTFNATYQTIYPENASCPLDRYGVKLSNSKSAPIPYYEVDGTYLSPYLLFGRTLDLTTETERWPGYTTTVIGVGPDARADAYAPQENVTLYAYLTYGGAPIALKNVAFEIHSPHNDTVFTRQAQTNISGIATITFRIPWPDVNPEDKVFGDWHIYASADVAEQKVSDTLNFTVGWIVHVMTAYTTDSAGTPKSSFIRGVETVYLKIQVENIGNISRDVYVDVVIYDDLGVPVASIHLLTTITPGETTLINFGMLLPSWSYVGEGTVHINLYTGNMPKESASCYAPEYTTTCAITA